jgi:exosortase N
MHWIITKYKWHIIAIVLIGLLAFNYKILFFGLDSDFFGIIFSVVLFTIGSRTTKIKINYLLLAIIFIFEFISFRLHTKSLHFLSLMLFICMIYYSITKKFSFIAFICILLFSSVFNKFFEHLTTEIKQQLCYVVFITLKNSIAIDKIEGVNFYINGAKITIDTACMGLSMFKTGLLTGAILLTLEEKKQKKYFTIFQISLFSCVVIILNIVSNYFRIVTLVILNCTKENALHHTVGLLCFAFYQVLPMLILIRYFRPKITTEIVVSKKQTIAPISLTLITIVITSIEMKQEQNHDLLYNLGLEYNIKKGKWVNNEVYQIIEKEKLIYIKTPIHKPLICWNGDGYRIYESREITRNNEKIWFNKMEKKNVIYDSYWWYECGNKKYSSFIEVMLMKLIYNQPIRLINEISIENKKPNKS